MENSEKRQAWQAEFWALLAAHPSAYLVDAEMVSFRHGRTDLTKVEVRVRLKTPRTRAGVAPK